MESLLTFLLFLPFLLLVAIANLGQRHPWARYVTYGSLALIDLGLLGLSGLALLSLMPQRLVPDQLPAQGLTDEIHIELPIGGENILPFDRQ